MNILIKPIITEKATAQSEDENVYAFEVVRTANKVEIKKAVEEIVRLDISPASAGAFIFLCKTKEDSQKDFDDKFLINFFKLSDLGG